MSFSQLSSKTVHYSHIGGGKLKASHNVKPTILLIRYIKFKSDFPIPSLLLIATLYQVLSDPSNTFKCEILHKLYKRNEEDLQLKTKSCFKSNPESNIKSNPESNSRRAECMSVIPNVLCLAQLSNSNFNVS